MREIRPAMGEAAGSEFNPQCSKTVLLVNPWIHDFAAYDYWVQPLGLLYLASLLRRRGIRTSLVNCLDPFHPGMKGAAQPLRSESGRGKFFQEEIPKPPALNGIRRKYKRYGIKTEIFRGTLQGMKAPDLVLVTSMMTYWYPGVCEAVSIIREVYPGVPIVLGGNYARLCREHAQKKSGADVVITSEAQEAIPDILDLLGMPFAPADFSEDLDSLPYPAFDLLTKPAQVPIITSRGCPFRCTYCASPVLNEKFRRRDPIRVADEIQFWNVNGIRNFSIYDDAFLVRPEEMAIPLMREVISRNLECRFHCPNGLHLREITGEIAVFMRKSGFATLRFGFETSEPQRQIETGGKVKGEHLHSAVGHLKRAGYATSDIGVYLLCGLPGQQAAEIRDSIKYVKSSGGQPILAEFSPIPGIAIWEECRESSNFDLDEPLFHNNTLLPCASPDISEGEFRALKRFCRT